MYQVSKHPSAMLDASHATRSAAVAKRRLHAALPIDRARAAAHHDDAKLLLIRLLQEDLCPQERRVS